MTPWLSEHLAAPAIIILVGALISAFGAWWSQYDRGKAERELRSKTEEIAELNKKISASVTGGDSFCYIAFGLPTPPSRTATLLLIQHGEYPVYDISVRIVDLQKFNEAFKSNPHPTLENLAQTETFLSLGNMPPHASRILGRLELPVGDRVDFNIFFSARNGFVTESARLRRIDGEWSTAYRVDSGGPGKPKVLYEQVSPQYPKNKEGKVEWN